MYAGATADSGALWERNELVDIHATINANRSGRIVENKKPRQWMTQHTTKSRSLTSPSDAR